MAKKQWYRMAAKDKTAEIYIYDEIGAGFYGEGVTAKGFADDLAALGELSEIQLNINSPGGDVFDGVAIYNMLQRNKANVRVRVDGIAASIASIIAMAGDSIEIAANGMFMIHDPYTIAMGNAAEMRKQADVLDQIASTMVGTYSRRTKLEEASVKAMMAEEKWMEADEAVALGFADSKSGAVNIAASVAKFDLSRWKNVPRALIAQPEQPKPPNLDDKIAGVQEYLKNLRERRAARG